MAQWIALGVTVVLATVSILTGLYQSSQSAKAATASQSARADMATMKLAIMEKIGETLGDFVRSQTLKDYIEGHAKEHRTIEQELTRLRDWKDHMDGDMRTTKNLAVEMAHAVDEINRVVKDMKHGKEGGGKEG